MANPPPPEASTADYSATATIITFPAPLPLLRHPTTSSTPPLLAFKSPQHFSSALKSAYWKLVSQCESGARIGCALSASERCREPWWRSLSGGGRMGIEEREKCEERKMGECMEAAKEKCEEFARKKCVAAFQDAQVVGKDGNICRRSDLLDTYIQTNKLK